MSLEIVDFPAPVGPTIAKEVPLGMEKFMLSKTFLLPSYENETFSTDQSLPRHERNSEEIVPRPQPEPHCQGHSLTCCQP